MKLKSLLKNDKLFKSITIIVVMNSINNPGKQLTSFDLAKEISATTTDISYKIAENPVYFEYKYSKDSATIELTNISPTRALMAELLSFALK